MASCLPSRMALPISPGGHRTAAVAAQAAAAQAAVAVQAAALEQLREKLECGEPPEKKMMYVAEEQQIIMQHALHQNLLAMATQLPLNIKLNNRGETLDTHRRFEYTDLCGVYMFSLSSLGLYKMQ